MLDRLKYICKEFLTILLFCHPYSWQRNSIAGDKGVLSIYSNLLAPSPWSLHTICVTWENLLKLKRVFIFPSGNWEHLAQQLIMVKRTEWLANIQSLMNVLYYYVIGIIIVCHYFYSGNIFHSVSMKLH